MDEKAVQAKIGHHMEPHRLERYSFLWSEARLVIASVALFLGGVPVIFVLVPIPGFYWLIRFGLTLAWIISGAASAYLLYRWYDAGKTLFGGKAPRDIWAFLVCVVSGFNLGVAGIFGINVGMTIAPFYGIFVIVGLLYIATAAYLYSRWQASGQSLFGHAGK